MAFAFLALMAGITAAQTYPAKSIRIVVPWPPGGGTDLVARTVAQKMHETLGQSAIVDNRAGANGIIGADLVAKAPADGSRRTRSIQRFTPSCRTTHLRIWRPCRCSLNIHS